jgi:hypothetical protein
MTNQQFALEDKAFQDACKRAGIPATKRQASKFRLKDGRAWEHRNVEMVDNQRDFTIDTSK